jgi:ribonuclease I
VRHYLHGKKKFLALLAMVPIGLAAWFSQRDAGNSPPESASVDDTQKPAGKLRVEFITEPSRSPAPNAGKKAAFDFYLLALTSHPAFCADGHARKSECNADAPPTISIHGLWPERLEPGKYPRDCAGPALDLDGGLELELAPLMPGMADGLHEHEWRSHGRCSGLDDDEYFRHTLDLARRVDGVLRAKLTTLAGDQASAAELREYADSYQAGLGATLTFHCRMLRDAPAAHRRQPYLIEIRQCVDNDGAAGAPATLLDCASVNRRDQGCGKGFRIAEAGRR